MSTSRNMKSWTKLKKNRQLFRKSEAYRTRSVYTYLQDRTGNVEVLAGHIFENILHLCRTSVCVDGGRFIERHYRATILSKAMKSRHSLLSKPTFELWRN